MPGFSAEYKAMATEPIVESQTGSYRYEAIVRISETIAACREPEELATTLADEIGKFLNFDHMYFVVLKENTKEIEYILWGKSPIPLAPFQGWLLPKLINLIKSTYLSFSLPNCPTNAAKMQPELRMRCLPHIAFRWGARGLNNVQTVLSKE